MEKLKYLKNSNDESIKNCDPCINMRNAEAIGTNIEQRMMMDIGKLVSKMKIIKKKV